MELINWEKNWEINWFLPKMAPFASFSHPYLANGFHDPGFFLIIKIIRYIYIYMYFFLNLNFFNK
jgi:hypothetical protein